MKKNKDALKRSLIRPAIVEIETEWGTGGRNKHHWTSFEVERYIWRSEDLPSHRVALGECLNTELTKTTIWHVLETRMLEYVPTGRIMYDNASASPEAVLFEYRLKQSRDTRN